MYQLNNNGFCAFPTAIMEAPLFYSYFYDFFGLDDPEYDKLTNWTDT